jgi:hypothetical protein
MAGLVLAWLYPSHVRGEARGQVEKQTPAMSQATAGGASKSRERPQATTAQPMARAASVSPVTQAAVNMGVLSCASRINQVVNFLKGDGRDGGVFIFTPPAEPDRSMFSVSMEVAGAGTGAVYATATFAPNQANGCGALYETVAFWPAACEDVVKRHFAGMVPIREAAQQHIAVLGGPGPARVFVMQAGTGCVPVKKEVVR